MAMTVNEKITAVRMPVGVESEEWAQRGVVDATEQLQGCLAVEDTARGALMADHHKGYSCPIGGVVAYQKFVSPSAVGYDIGCGNLAAKTDILCADVDMKAIMDEVAKTISFGVGRSRAGKPIDVPVLEEIAKHPLGEVNMRWRKAQDQLGTVGSGNHYVDLFEDAEDGYLWVGVHFGSRGFGHGIATTYMDYAQRLQWKPEFLARLEGVKERPDVLPVDSPLGQAYWEAMNVAGRYSFAGRDWVVDTIVDLILRGKVTERIHNNHNLAWKETHFGETYYVHRKGATPAFPGQYGFIGSTMGEPSVIVRGRDLSDPTLNLTDTVEVMREMERNLFSTVHGAGRQMGRMEAKGKVAKDGTIKRAGKIDWAVARAEVLSKGIELRGADADEAPGAYKRLDTVLDAHKNTIEVVRVLLPRGVAMAGVDVIDPWKD